MELKLTTVGFGRGANVVAIKPETIQKLEGKFGREKTEEFLREYNISGNIEALTEGEGQYVGSYSSLDTIRKRIAEEGFAKHDQDLQGSIQRFGVTPSSPSDSSSTTANITAELLLIRPVWNRNNIVFPEYG